MTSARGARDTHLKKIEESLSGPLDKDLFEECVQDLLRAIYPGLTGVYGGSDGGMDGAIPDGEGEPLALIATTAKDVIGNLTRSLDRLLAVGDTRRTVVSATSQELTPRRRKNLFRRAEEKGFTLKQVHECRDLAALLYRDSRWTEQLLSITGRTSALSTIPKTRRDPSKMELVAREQARAWLRETSGDRLLVGEPGSGKTSLLVELVRSNKALFLVDLRDFASAYRDQQPQLVLVDDAHVDPDRLVRLRQIRREIHAEDHFAIVASSWRGARDEVADALGGPVAASVHELELLTRREILEILQNLEVSLAVDSPYLKDLVSQAANKPGLAVTLGRAWRAGDFRGVLSGTALYREVIPYLGRVLSGGSPVQFLAALALGGDRGMDLGSVAEFLGRPIADVWELATSIGHSGILKERSSSSHDEAVFSLEPPALRAPLLEEVFFGGGGRPWQHLLERAVDPARAVEGLTEAASRGVPVPGEDLRRLLKEHGSIDAWRNYAALDEGPARWVLDNYPGSCVDVAPVTLGLTPSKTIRILLEMAEADLPHGLPRPRGPLAILKVWSRDIPDQGWPEEVLRRRRLAVAEAIRFAENGGSSEVAMRVAFEALSPRVESHRTTVTGQEVHWRVGHLPASSVEVMTELWTEVRVLLTDLSAESWADLNRVLHWWIHPGKEQSGVDRQRFRHFAQRVASDVAAEAVQRPGLQRALQAKGRVLDLEFDFPRDRDFETLYPDLLKRERSCRETLQDARRVADENAQALGRVWAKRPGREVLDDLERYELESAWLSASADPSLRFEAALAQAVVAPEEWLALLLERQSGARRVWRFLEQAVSQRRPYWRPLLEACLVSERYRWAGVETVLRMSSPPGDFLEGALAVSEPEQIETACLQGEVSVSLLLDLLDSADPAIALAAAVGEWLCEPRESVREEVQKSWRAAILNPEAALKVGEFPEGEHWLGVILASDPLLSFDWVLANAKNVESSATLSAVDSSPFIAAARALSEEQKSDLLKILPTDGLHPSAVRVLIGDSLELYARLLRRATKPALQVAPLTGMVPSERWCLLAKMALAAGVDPHQIAEETLFPVGGFTPSAEHWLQWVNGFRGLSEEQAGSLDEVIRHGMAIANELVEKERKRARHFALTGAR